MALVQRHLSIQFNTYQFKGITHGEILQEIEDLVELNKVKSVQFTEKHCIISLRDNDSKELVMSSGITLKNRSVKFNEVEKTITNVTVKDLPYEIDDCYVATQMLKFGAVVPGSVKRGKIKGTDIDNGSRYLQILNCVQTLPNRTNFGRFAVRIFADNNRTECTFCRCKDHPSYACKVKPKYDKICYNCTQSGHIAKDCKNEPCCSFCKQSGHARNKCAEFATYKAKKDYGDYAAEILEGQTADLKVKTDNQHPSDSDTTSNTQESVKAKTLENDEACDKQFVILGASNAKRLGNFQENLVNASISGATLESVKHCIDQAMAKLDYTACNVKKVVMCLGTNDVSKCKDDSDQINVLLTQAISQVKCAFPLSRVGVCSILPRKGKGQRNICLNQSSNCVNNFAKKLCSKEPLVDYVDLTSSFMRQGNVIKSLYDSNDDNGIHISAEGKDKICTVLNQYFNDTPADHTILPETPNTDRKRTLSDISATPTSADRKTKQSKPAGSPNCD